MIFRLKCDAFVWYLSNCENLRSFNEHDLKKKKKKQFDGEWKNKLLKCHWMPNSEAKSEKKDWKKERMKRIAQELDQINETHSC